MKKRIFFFLFSFCFSACAQNVIYVVHPEAAPGNFSPGSPWYNVKEAVRRLGYDARWVKTSQGLKDYDYIIYFDIFPWDIENIKTHPKEKLIAFLWEPPTVLPFNYGNVFQEYFSKIVTWADSLVDNRRFFKFYYPVHVDFPRSVMPFEERKLCVMINRNKDSKHSCSLYGERKKLIEFFENNHSEDFDLYGYGWETAGFKNYRGTIGLGSSIDAWRGTKHECMRNYKFYFAYENMQHIDGYVTEKIFDSFKAGCVPVYWGAQNITDYVPKSCFIDRRDFANDEELYQFLKNMTEEEYGQYLNNIKYFLESSEALLFSWEYFVHVFLDIIEPGYNRYIVLSPRQLHIVEQIFQTQEIFS